jgi:prefoldin subunit 5
MSDDQYQELMSQLRVLSTKIKFIEDDVQEIKYMIQTLSVPDKQDTEDLSNWKVVRL